MASGGGSGFDLNVGISLDGVIIYAVDDVASVVEDGKLPRQPMALTGRITEARGGYKKQRDGHTGARTQDHSVISTALYRLSYTTSLRTTSLNKITKLHTAYLQHKLIPYAHAHSQLNTATTDQ